MKVASVRGVCGLKLLLAEIYFKNLSTTSAKQVFLFFSVTRDKTGEGIFTKSINLRNGLKSLKRGNKNMKILVLYSGELGKKVIQNLVNSYNFCVSCGELCNHCRQARKSYANLIVGIHEFPDDLPTFIEEPSQYMPPNLPACDLILAIGIHPDLYAAIPEVVLKTGQKP